MKILHQTPKSISEAQCCIKAKTKNLFKGSSHFIEEFQEGPLENFV